MGGNEQAALSKQLPNLSSVPPQARKLVFPSSAFGASSVFGRAKGASAFLQQNLLAVNKDHVSSSATSSILFSFNGAGITGKRLLEMPDEEICRLLKSELKRTTENDFHNAINYKRVLWLTVLAADSLAVAAALYSKSSGEHALALAEAMKKNLLGTCLPLKKEEAAMALSNGYMPGREDFAALVNYPNTSEGTIRLLKAFGSELKEFWRSLDRELLAIINHPTAQKKYTQELQSLMFACDLLIAGYSQLQRTQAAELEGKVSKFPLSDAELARKY